MKTPFTPLNLSSIEHVCVEYHVAESFDACTQSIGRLCVQLHFLYNFILVV
jgi:hypothetical protein